AQSQAEAPRHIRSGKKNSGLGDEGWPRSGCARRNARLRKATVKQCAATNRALQAPKAIISAKAEANDGATLRRHVRLGISKLEAGVLPGEAGAEEFPAALLYSTEYC